MTLWVRCRGDHTLRVDLEDGRASNDVLIIEHGV